MAYIEGTNVWFNSLARWLWICAERWGRKNGFGGYVMNCCFLMAAKRAGFLIEPREVRYAGAPEGGKGSTWDCHNAYINISSRHRPK